MIFHLGFHKTGTSYLQAHVYPRISNYNTFSWGECDEIFRSLITENVAFYSAEQTIKKWKELEKEPELPSFFSYEEFMGPLFYQSSPNLDTKVQRIKALGIKKVILTLRNQLSMIDSIYRQYIQKGGVVRSSDFLDTNLRIFNRDYCNYGPIVQYLVREFGKENVLVLLHEELKENEQAFMAKIEAFGGIVLKEAKDEIKTSGRGVNRSISNLSVGFLRQFNHISYNHFKPSSLISKKLKSRRMRNLLQNHLDPKLLSKFSNRKNFFKAQKASLEDYYRHGNRELATTFGLDLASYGYPV